MNSSYNKKINTNINYFKNNSIVIRIIMILIGISIFIFLYGLYNYFFPYVAYGDKFTTKYGGGETIGTIITIPVVDENKYPKIHDINFEEDIFLLQENIYFISFKVSYNINNKLYEKKLYTNDFKNKYQLNNKIDLLYDKNNNVIFKSDLYDELGNKKYSEKSFSMFFGGYMSNDFYSKGFMKFGIKLFIILIIILLLFIRLKSIYP